MLKNGKNKRKTNNEMGAWKMRKIKQKQFA